LAMLTMVALAGAIAPLWAAWDQMS